MWDRSTMNHIKIKRFIFAVYWKCFFHERKNANTVSKQHNIIIALLGKLIGSVRRRHCTEDIPLIFKNNWQKNSPQLPVQSNVSWTLTRKRICKGNRNKTFAKYKRKTFSDMKEQNRSLRIVYHCANCPS